MLPRKFSKNEALQMCFLNSVHKYVPVLNLKTTVFDANCDKLSRTQKLIIHKLLTF